MAGDYAHVPTCHDREGRPVIRLFFIFLLPLGVQRQEVSGTTIYPTLLPNIYPIGGRTGLTSSRIWRFLTELTLDGFLFFLSFRVEELPHWQRRPPNSPKQREAFGGRMKESVFVQKPQEAGSATAITQNPINWMTAWQEHGSFLDTLTFTTRKKRQRLLSIRSYRLGAPSSILSQRHPERMFFPFHQPSAPGISRSFSLSLSRWDNALAQRR